MNTPPPGAFGSRHARRKDWQTDAGLTAALGQLCKTAGTTQSWLDYGAGYGKYVLWLREQGQTAHGLDGIPGVAEATGGLVAEADITRPQPTAATVDIAICIEVGEHIPAEHAGGLLDNLAQARELVVISWATPGQRGRNHINCRTPEDVQADLEARDCLLLEGLTKRLRHAAGRGWNRKLLVLLTHARNRRKTTT